MIALMKKREKHLVLYVKVYQNRLPSSVNPGAFHRRHTESAVALNEVKWVGGSGASKKADDRDRQSDKNRLTFHKNKT